MHSVLLKIVNPLLLALSLLTPSSTPANAQTATAVQDRPVIRRAIPDRLRNRALQFVRTELFFGTATPTCAVAEEQFLAFVDAEVTPRFPDGLTLLKGHGQFTARTACSSKRIRSFWFSCTRSRA